MLFLTVFFLTPFGLQYGGEVVWATDFVALLIIVIFIVFLLSLQMGFKFKAYSLTSPLFFLIVFFALEFFLPLFGVLVWSDLSSASSSLRALLYWLPFFLVFLTVDFQDGISFEKIDKVFFFSIIFNLLFGVVELAIYFEKLPEALNFRLYLDRFAPQERYLQNRIMSFGFFQNSTAYGVFGLFSLIHCICRLLQTDQNKLKFYFFGILSFIIIILSTSRVPLAVAIIALIMFLSFLRRTQWNLLLGAVFSIIGSLVLVSLFTIDIALFSRFSRLVEGGLQGDYSLNQRITVHWPYALEFYDSLSHPIFTNPSKLVGTIDSGYLTYLLQGGLLTSVILATLLISSLVMPLKDIILGLERSYFSYFLFFISIYIVLGMLISNPMRNPMVIAFFCYAVFGFSARKKFGGHA